MLQSIDLDSSMHLPVIDRDPTLRNSVQVLTRTQYFARRAQAHTTLVPPDSGTNYDRILSPRPSNAPCYELSMETVPFNTTTHSVAHSINFSENKIISNKIEKARMQRELADFNHRKFKTFLALKPYLL